MTLSEKLTVFRLCLESNVLTISQIVKWADAQIIEHQNQDNYYLYDLSLAKSKGINEVIHIIQSNESKTIDVNTLNLVYGLAGYLLKTKQINLEKACLLIYSSTNESLAKTDFEILGMSLNDAFYLADQGISGNLEDVHQTVIKLSTPHIKRAKSFYLKELKT